MHDARTARAGPPMLSLDGGELLYRHFLEDLGASHYWRCPDSPAEDKLTRVIGASLKIAWVITNDPTTMGRPMHADQLASKIGPYPSRYEYIGFLQHLHSSTPSSSIHPRKSVTLLRCATSPLPSPPPLTSSRHRNMMIRTPSRHLAKMRATPRCPPRNRPRC